MTISEAFEAHDWELVGQDATAKTRKNYRTAFFGRNGLLSVTEDIPVEAINLNHIIQWKLQMREEGLQPRAINAYVLAVRRIWRFLGDNNNRVMEYHKIPFDTEENSKPHEVLTTDDVKRLMEATKNPRDKAIIQLFFGTGCRSAEIIGLDRDDWHNARLINPDEGVWEIFVLGKNKKYRPVCFYQEVKNAVDLYLSSRSDNFRPLFISRQNRRVHTNTIGAMLHKLSAIAGLDKRVTQHVFRHSYATDKGAKGMPLPTLAYSLGHKNSAITQKVYTHINVKHSRDAYAKYGTKLLTNEA